MRLLPAAFIAALAPCAGSALGQPSPANADTYRAVIAHGLVILTPDAEIDVAFSPDGTFKAFQGMATGKWKIVGDKLCSTDDATLIETCAVYPPGKASGDTFELDTPTGRVPVRIR